MNRRSFVKRASGLFVPACFGIFVPRLISQPGGVFLTKNQVKSVGGGPTYVIQENCDGTGTPAGWTNDGTQVTTTSWDYATSPAPLEGTQSLQIVQPANSGYTYYDITALSELWVYMLVNVSSHSGTNASFFQFLDVGGTVQARVGLDSSNHLDIFDDFSANEQVTTDALSTATTYSLWGHYKVGSGTNGVLDAEFATTPTMVGSGNKFKQITTGHGTANITRFRIGNSNAPTITFICDKIRVASTSIGSNPS